jgi:hypothetical protein
MRFRVGLIVGFGAGYYLGSMAGRARYEQINRMLRKAKRSDAYEAATDKAKAVVDLGVERAKDLVDSKLGHDGDGADTGGGNGGRATRPLADASVAPVGNDPYIAPTP